MAFNTVPGRLYIIGEQDVFGGSSSPYFKVGIVKEEREVDERLREHQTGNPRRLIVKDLIEVAAVEYLETHLHHRLATKVAFSEWFKLSEAEYVDLLELARRLSDEVTRQAPLAEKAAQLKEKVSNGLIIPPAADVWQVHNELYPDTVKVKKLSSSVSTLTTTVRNRAAVKDKAPVGQRKINVSNNFFDATKFQEENPELVAQFQKKSISGRFTVKKIAEIDAELASFDPLKVYLDLSLEDLERISEKDLEQARRQLTEVEAVSEWSEKHHGVAIKSAVGENDGIENVASWKRTLKSSFDQTALKKAEPELYARYVEIRLVERWVKINQGIEESDENSAAEL
jgi:hypothetical protein